MWGIFHGPHGVSKNNPDSNLAPETSAKITMPPPSSKQGLKFVLVLASGFLLLLYVITTFSHREKTEIQPISTDNIAQTNMPDINTKKLLADFSQSKPTPAPAWTSIFMKIKETEQLREKIYAFIATQQDPVTKASQDTPALLVLEATSDDFEVLPSLAPFPHLPDHKIAMPISLAPVALSKISTEPDPALADTKLLKTENLTDFFNLYRQSLDLQQKLRLHLSSIDAVAHPSSQADPSDYNFFANSIHQRLQTPSNPADVAAQILSETMPDTPADERNGF